MKMRSLFSASTLIASLSLLGAAANAVPLAPGDTVVLPGTTVAADPQLAGLIIEDELVDFEFAGTAGTISGQIQMRVVRSSLDNTLDFYWRVFNSSDSIGAIGSFRIGNFSDSTFDADWRIDGLGAVAPTSAHRFDGTQTEFLNFDFGQGIAAGSSSKFMFLDTNALTYSRTAIMDVTNVGQTRISDLFTAFEPSRVSVPEPATLALMALGVVGLALARRRYAPAVRRS